MNESELRAFGRGIQRLINKENLSRAEAFDLFSMVLSNRQPDLQQGAFLAALVAKGETADELAGAWQAIDSLDTLHADIDGTELVENAGTGMDGLKTFNASSAAAITAAACGVRMARHGARALTSSCGTVDIMEACGLRVACSVRDVARSIETCGIGLFNGMSAEVHPVALGRILSQIRFGSSLNIAASLANPARPKRAVRGVYAERLVPLTVDLMREIGYLHGMVVYGVDQESGLGMDELSVCGPTLIEAFDQQQRRTIQMTPEEAGVRRWPFACVRALANRDDEVQRFQNVLAGTERGACEDFTVLNAAAILVVAGMCHSLSDGVEHARDAIRSGKADQKLQQWIATQ